MTLTRNSPRHAVGVHGQTGRSDARPGPLMGPPMYHDIIGDKRASLSPAQRPRNGFCSTCGRRETRVSKEKSSGFRPSTGKGSDFNANSVCFGIDVGLGGSNAHRLDSAEGGDAIEDGVGQSFLQIVTAG